MKAANTYLLFDGDCREAMEFYQKCIGGELHLMRFSDVDAPGCEAGGDRILHAALPVGSAMLMASDIQPGMNLQRGDNFSVSLSCESMEEIQRVFGALSEGGQVKMALEDTFWGAHFGMLTDRFGIGWMLSYEK
jgi:PhnB protein